MRYDELSPQRLIDQLRAWFFAKDRSIVLDDGTFIEYAEISGLTNPTATRHDAYAARDSSGVGVGLYHLNESGAERQYSGDIAAWETAISAHLALPGLRAFWPFSCIDYTNPQVKDIAGGGYHLTNNNTSTFGYGPSRILPPCVFLDGTSQYLSRADGGAGNWADITGTEAYITRKGLSLGMWLYPREVGTGANQHYIGKWSNVAADRAYRITQTAAGAYYAQVVGAGPIQVGLTGADAVLHTWTHVVEVFSPNALYLYVNGVQYSDLTGIPASIQDTTADFTIGDRSTTGEQANCIGSLAFLSACALDQKAVVALYNQSRSIFGI